MGALVVPGQLETYLQHPVRDDVEAIAIRVAEGWLRSVTPSLTDWPDPVPEDLWAWALELASIAYTNPEGLATRTVGDEVQGWVIARRQEILAAAARRYGATAPVGSFPPAPCWPETDRPIWGWGPL